MRLLSYLRKAYQSFWGTIYQYRFLPLSEDDTWLYSHIWDKAYALAEQEKVKVYQVPYDVLNASRSPSKEATAIFVYSEEGQFSSQNMPRIVLSERASVWTLIHELGHYFIYKKGEKQSEKEAHVFISEFFQVFPPFFRRIYQIQIKVYAKVDRPSFSSQEAYQHWKAYKKFCRENGRKHWPVERVDKSTRQ